MVSAFIQIYAGSLVCGSGIPDFILCISTLHPEAGTGEKTGSLAYPSGEYYWSDGVYSFPLFNKGIEFFQDDAFHFLLYQCFLWCYYAEYYPLDPEGDAK